MQGQAVAPGNTNRIATDPANLAGLQRRPKDEEAARASLAPAASSALVRPQGRLSESEIAMLCAAYVAGASGELLIGLRQRLRVFTIMLPMQSSEQLAVAQMERAGRQMRALRCDGRLYARRARLLATITAPCRDALVIDSLENGSREQVVLLLDGSARRLRLQEHFMEDAVTRALSKM